MYVFLSIDFSLWVWAYTSEVNKSFVTGPFNGNRLKSQKDNIDIVLSIVNTSGLLLKAKDDGQFSLSEQNVYKVKSSNSE